MTETQRFCTSCGQPLPEGARFCSSCGTPVGGAARNSAGGAPVSAPPPKLALRDFLVVVALLALVTVGFLIFRSPSQAPAPPPGQKQMTDDPHAGTDMAGAMAKLNLPTDYASLVQFGNRTMDSGSFPVAAECYRRALEIDSTSLEVRTDFGSCLHAMGLPQRALEQFRIVQARTPHPDIVEYNLGIVFADLKQPDSAKFYWQEYLKEAPNGQAASQARELLKSSGG